MIVSPDELPSREADELPDLRRLVEESLLERIEQLRLAPSSQPESPAMSINSVESATSPTGRLPTPSHSDQTNPEKAVPSPQADSALRRLETPPSSRSPSPPAQRIAQIVTCPSLYPLRSVSPGTSLRHTVSVAIQCPSPFGATDSERGLTDRPVEVRINLAFVPLSRLLCLLLVFILAGQENY
ncbi:unnamed protein product [Protopolystoma xenopodis]|uniref:Uncharacterized protein n=1 Tax=Protopolystoma xenopodis TaxID=117903 RepID=A0A3S5CJS0_9PLAT|nr:unnamed protein product [Protopolystoma xenopodis]